MGREEMKVLEVDTGFDVHLDVCRGAAERSEVSSAISDVAESDEAHLRRRYKIHPFKAVPRWRSGAPLMNAERLARWRRMLAADPSPYRIHEWRCSGENSHACGRTSCSTRDS